MAHAGLGEREQCIWILASQEALEAETPESLKFGNKVKTLHPSDIHREEKGEGGGRGGGAQLETILCHLSFWSKCVLVVWRTAWIRRRESCVHHPSPDSHMHSMELSANCPSGGSIFAGKQEGGSMLPMLGDGSTFSQSSILSAAPSQLMWKRVTRGLDAKMFLWSCGDGREFIYS